MKAINKITMINIYIANRVLHNHFDKGMAEDLLAIEDMFQTNDFSGLDDIYQKYFVPDQETTPPSGRKKCPEKKSNVPS